MDKSLLIDVARGPSQSKWRHHQLPRFIAALGLLLISFSQTKLCGQSFGNVALGGGGFVTGIISHKTSGDVYCRTDVGGAYRWDAPNSKWIPLLDWTSDDQTTYQGIEALALDPQNANNLYLLAGTSYFNGGKTAILKSTDKGNTFSEVIVTSQFTAHGNGLGRSNGERLAVDPNNSNVLFCGTRSNGLWKSTNGGASWTQAWNGVTTTTNGNGICFVVFDPSSVSGGVTRTIYIGVSRTGGNNIYKSTDGGSTFTAIQPDNSFMPHRAALSSDNSTLYVAMADAEGPSSGSSGRVYKLATATGTWTNITPDGNNYPYGGVSVDPANRNRIVVSTVNVWNNNQFGATWGDFIYLSTDGGTTWTSKLTATSTMNNNGIGWITGSGIHWAGSIDFDPSNTARVRVMSGNGLFTCDDINASAVSWKFDVKGMEETVVLDAISIPGGKLISAVGDQYGAAYSDVYAYPTQVHTPTVTSNNGIAFAANNVNKIVRSTDKLYYSTDQGTTWTAAANTPGGGYGKIALSADGNTTLYCPSGGSTTFYSTNNGGTWTSTGVTNVQNAHPIADYVNTNKFYIYSPGSGQLLVSTNKGVSFTASSSTPGSGGSNRARAVPGNEGHVWIALANGLTYTTNNGSSWTTVSNVSYCAAVGFGKAATGATYPAVYIWGTVNGVRGMFRSTDRGVSWTRINDDAHEWGGPGNGNFVMGDMNVFGRAYMSTVGRGLIAIESATIGCTPTAITPYLQINGGTWTQTSSGTVSSGATVVLGPQPTTGGSWSWTGCGTSGTSREQSFTATNSCTATATYTNASGCTSTQAFTITVSSGIVSGGTYRIVARHSSKSIGINGGSTTAGATVTQQTYSGAASQMFVITDLGNGYYRISPTSSSSMALDVNAASTADGASIIQWNYGGSNNQQWQIVPNGSYFNIKSRSSGKCMDVSGVSTADGASVVQWTCGAGTNQQFTFDQMVSANGSMIELVEPQLIESVTVYPNPSSTGFQIRAVSDFTYQICDPNGRTVESGKGSDGSVVGNTLKPGLHLLIVRIGITHKTIKLIKE